MAAVPVRPLAMLLPLTAVAIAVFALVAAFSTRPVAPVADHVPDRPLTLWLDDGPVTIGEPVLARYEGDVITIRGGTNVGGAGIAGGGNGVLLVLQAGPGQRLGPGATPIAVRIVSLAVWREAAFSAGTRSADPGAALGGLELSFGDRLKGSYEGEITGGLGPFHARMTFDVPPPRASAP